MLAHHFTARAFDDGMASKHQKSGERREQDNGKDVVHDGGQGSHMVAPLRQGAARRVRLCRRDALAHVELEFPAAVIAGHAPELQ
jgi:hypothetical protein